MIIDRPRCYKISSSFNFSIFAQRQHNYSLDLHSALYPYILSFCSIIILRLFTKQAL